MHGLNKFRIFFISDSDRSKSKKKKKRSDKTRQRSLSPLSRRMALLSGAVDPNIGEQGNNSAFNYSQIFGSTSDALPNDYDIRVSSNKIFNENI